MNRALKLTYLGSSALGLAMVSAVVPADRMLLGAASAIAIAVLYSYRSNWSRTLFVFLYLSLLGFGFILSANFYKGGSVNSEGMTLSFFAFIISFAVVMRIFFLEDN